MLKMCACSCFIPRMMAICYHSHSFGDVVAAVEAAHCTVIFKAISSIVSTSQSFQGGLRTESVSPQGEFSTHTHTLTAEKENGTHTLTDKRIHVIDVNSHMLIISLSISMLMLEPIFVYVQYFFCVFLIRILFSSSHQLIWFCSLRNSRILLSIGSQILYECVCHLHFHR